LFKDDFDEGADAAASLAQIAAVQLDLWRESQSREVTANRCFFADPQPQKAKGAN